MENLKQDSQTRANSATNVMTTIDSQGVQLLGNPRGLRIAPLASDAVADRLDYVIKTGPKGGQPSLEAYAPGDVRLFAVADSSIDPSLDLMLVDVVDLTGQGQPVAIVIGNGPYPTAPVLYLIGANGTIQAQYTCFPQRTSLNAGSVRAYDVAGTTQKRIIAAPNTFFADRSGPASVSVYFFDPNLSVLAAPVVDIGPQGEMLTFPAVAAGDIAGTGTQIVVMSKSRLLLFDQNGNKIFYNQFVDPNGSFTRYNADADKPPAGTQLPPGTGTNPSYEGRRYGLYRLLDVDADGKLELVVCGDRINQSSIIPGAVYEAYDLDAHSGSYIAPKWRVGLPLSSTPSKKFPFKAPSGYEIGVPVKGIDDLNGDGIPEIVLTDINARNRPIVRFINARTGAVTNGGIRGICLDVVRFRGNTMPADLVIYDPVTKTHSIWRFTAVGSLTLTQLANPDGTLSSSTAGAVAFSQPSYPFLPLYGLDTSESTFNHTGVMTSKSGGVQAIVGDYSPTFDPIDMVNPTCPLGLRSWSAAETAVQLSLDVATRPGKLVAVTKTIDPQNHVFLVNIETACKQATNSVKTFVQSGTNLVPNGDL